MNNILVTGATGFIGKNLVRTGEEFRQVSRRKPTNSYTTDFCNSTEIYTISRIDSTTCWEGAFESIDSVVHLAGLAHSSEYTLSDYTEVNVEGTLRLAREAVRAGVKRFVFVSSIVVYGAAISGEPFTHSSNLCPESNYAKSKLDAELGLRNIASETGMELVIVRPTLVYGPNAPGNFGLLAKVIDKLPFLPFGLATNMRDFIAVQNLTDLLIVCANHPDAPGHTFLASDGKAVSIKEFTNLIAKGLERTVVQLPVPVRIMRLLASLFGRSAMAEQLFGDLRVDSSNAQEVLGWVPPCTMEQAMATLIENKK
jgi:nucleoside-diphosphate-sugar epimerase